MELSPETCRVKPLRRINAIVASCWIYFTIKHDARNHNIKIWAGFLAVCVCVFVCVCVEFDIQNLVDNKSEGVCCGGVHLFTKCVLCNSAGLTVLDMNLFKI
jgi:cell shape-determining protein MreD